MAKDPAFLFYSSDFLSGISDLTMIERGQFITLLCLQHQKGELNEKTISLSIGSVSVDVMKKFKTDGKGNFWNERLLIETEKRNRFTESRRNNGLTGGRPKKKRKANGKASQNHMDNHMEDENEDVNRNKDANRKFDFKTALIDLGVSEPVATDWMAVRLKKRASNTETAFKLIAKEIAKSGLSAEHCITESAGRSWQTFKAEWLTNLNSNGNKQTTFKSKQELIGEQLAREKREAIDRINTALGKGNFNIQNPDAGS